jgi:hypothetical protein
VAAPGCHHGQANVVTDDNFFAYLASQDQHRSHSFLGDFDPTIEPIQRGLTRQLAERAHDLRQGERLSEHPDGSVPQKIRRRVGPRVPRHETATDSGIEFLECGQGFRTADSWHLHVEQDYGDLFAVTLV